MSRAVRVALLAAAIAAYITLGWIAGLLVLVLALVTTGRRLIRARLALAPSRQCPWCREEVSQYGPYSCTNCRARTLGWAWRCSVCAAWAGHIECPHCGMSVTNPLLGTP